MRHLALKVKLDDAAKPKWSEKIKAEVMCLTVIRKALCSHRFEGFLQWKGKQAVIARRCFSLPMKDIKGIDSRKSSRQLHQSSLNVNIWCPSCCHSPQLNVLTSWLSRAALFWKVVADGWLKDGKGCIFYWVWCLVRSFSCRENFFWFLAIEDPCQTYYAFKKTHSLNTSK